MKILPDTVRKIVENEAANYLEKLFNIKMP